MHILISSIVDLKKTAPNRLHHFIKYLIRNHEITVYCINDSWKSSKVNTQKSYKDFNDILDQIEIRYITDKKASPVFQELYAARNLNSIKNENYDVLFNYNTLKSGLYLKKKLNIPMIYDIADDLPAMIRNSPQIPSVLRPFAGAYGRYLVSKNIGISEAVTSISPNFKDIFKIPENKFYLIPNGVDTDLFKKVDSEVRERLGLSGYFVLGYVGVLREWVDFTPVYEALKTLDAVKLLIVGEEGNLEENRDTIRRFGIEDKVIFTGTIPYHQVPDYISAMDVCLIPFKNNAISQNAVPLKLFEYMACEKPVISTSLTSVTRLIGNRIFFADTANDYQIQINSIISQENESKKYENNRKFVCDNYDWNSINTSLERVLERR